MSNLELKRKQLELARVLMAKNEMEFRIEERMEEIGRLKDNIKAQEQKQNELNEEINSILDK